MNDSQEGLDIQVVRSEDDLKEHLLVDGDEFLVPLADVRRPLARLVLVLLRVCGGQGLAPVVLAVFKNLTCGCGAQQQAEERPQSARLLHNGVATDTGQEKLTFFSTLDETLGRGIG